MDSLPWGKVNIAEKRLRQPLSSTAFFRLDPDHYLTTYNAYSRFALYDKNLNLIDSIYICLNRILNRNYVYTALVQLTQYRIQRC